MRYALLSRLALADLCYDRKMSFFIVCSLMAVIAPLLLLFSLKFGIVFQLQTELLNNPQNLEIRIVGKPQNKVLNQQWFNELKGQHNVQFALPLVRSLNMLADVRKDGAHFIPGVELLPTATGDPLINYSLSMPNGVYLSASAAEALQVKVRDKLQLFFGRKYQGKEQKQHIELVVEGILPERNFGRKALFVSLPLLIEIENYRDGFRIQQFVASPTDGETLSAPRNDFASARIYASNLDGVVEVAQQLRQQGLEIRTQANEIENVKAIHYTLNVLFTIIAGASILGAMMSLSGSFLANIERKRKEISQFSLMGLFPAEMRFYLLFQAVLLATSAFIAASVVYFLCHLVINSVLGAHLAQSFLISTLLPYHFFVAFAFTLSISLIVAAHGAKKASKIQPAEVLREI